MLSYTVTHTYGFAAWCLMKQKENFAFTFTLKCFKLLWWCCYTVHRFYQSVAYCQIVIQLHVTLVNVSSFTSVRNVRHFIGRFWRQSELASCITHKHVTQNLSSNMESGASGGAVGSGTAIQAGRSRFHFPMVSLEFFFDIILPAWAGIAQSV
jgi:hypothetical protein